MFFACRHREAGAYCASPGDTEDGVARD